MSHFARRSGEKVAEQKRTMKDHAVQLETRADHLEECEELPQKREIALEKGVVAMAKRRPP